MARGCGQPAWVSVKEIPLPRLTLDNVGSQAVGGNLRKQVPTIYGRNEGEVRVSRAGTQLPRCSVSIDTNRSFVPQGTPGHRARRRIDQCNLQAFHGLQVEVAGEE